MFKTRFPISTKRDVHYRACLRWCRSSVVRTRPILALAIVFLLPLAAGAQDFGSKFFDDLRSLFGRLQRSELDRAFRQAKPIRCSDLAGEKAEWKEVAFLNDDRSLGDWHFDNIDEVKQDLVAFVFSGTCRGEQGPLSVTSSFPVTETVEQARDGKIPFSKIIITHNDPVSAIFDQPSGAYTFQLPYVYSERKNGTDIVYTLMPPRRTSKPEPSLAIEFRCKALSDADLTYRFLLCRNRVVNTDSRVRDDGRQSPGSAAYFILSDGKEASSSVKLNFGGTEEKAEPERRAPETTAPAPLPAPVSAWKPAPSDATLTNIGDAEFRLSFDAQTWKGRVATSQVLADGTLSNSPPPKNKDYCSWRPGAASQANQLLDTAAADSFGFSLSFRKDLQSATSSVFEIRGANGGTLATLQCYFPQSQTPSELTVTRWLSIVGKTIQLQVRQ